MLPRPQVSAAPVMRPAPAAGAPPGMVQSDVYICQARMYSSEECNEDSVWAWLYNATLIKFGPMCFFALWCWKDRSAKREATLIAGLVWWSKCSDFDAGAPAAAGPPAGAPVARPGAPPPFFPQGGPPRPGGPPAGAVPPGGRPPLQVSCLSHLPVLCLSVSF